MTRRKVVRTIYSKPKFSCFCPMTKKEVVFDEVLLSLDEAEAIRLKDLEDLDQLEASRSMSISRTTYLRILKTARRKIASCIINGKKLNIGGGDCICRKIKK
jgi:predicted DNA-binding protein (UPF0251 family)